MMVPYAVVSGSLKGRDAIPLAYYATVRDALDDIEKLGLWYDTDQMLFVNEHVYMKVSVLPVDTNLMQSLVSLGKDMDENI